MSFWLKNARVIIKIQCLNTETFSKKFLTHSLRLRPNQFRGVYNVLNREAVDEASLKSYIIILKKCFSVSFRVTHYETKQAHVLIFPISLKTRDELINCNYKLKLQRVVAKLFAESLYFPRSSIVPRYFRNIRNSSDRLTAFQQCFDSLEAFSNSRQNIVKCLELFRSRVSTALSVFRLNVATTTKGHNSRPIQNI